MIRPSEARSSSACRASTWPEQYYATQPLELTRNRKLLSDLDAINAETQLCFSTDYPHWDFESASTVYDLSFRVGRR